MSHNYLSLIVYIHKKRGTTMPRLKLEVVGKPLCTDMEIAAHA